MEDFYTPLVIFICRRQPKTNIKNFKYRTNRFIWKQIL